mmetsp:Transcript_165851/g.532517  ORF Transcript_165851/g.532517 Transcript_165851/m.532517 type:complete len:254 (+) Transcript_165851:1-762(+)
MQFNDAERALFGHSGRGWSRSSRGFREPEGGLDGLHQCRILLRLLLRHLQRQQKGPRTGASALRLFEHCVPPVDSGFRAVRLVQLDLALQYIFGVAELVLDRLQSGTLGALPGRLDELPIRRLPREDCHTVRARKLGDKLRELGFALHDRSFEGNACWKLVGEHGRPLFRTWPSDEPGTSLGSGRSPSTRQQLSQHRRGGASGGDKGEPAAEGGGGAGGRPAGAAERDLQNPGADSSAARSRASRRGRKPTMQ